MMRRFLTIALTAVAMLLVAVLAALLSLRVAIHGREATVPALAGLSDEDAAAAARKLGLNLSVENRFYSAAVPANHVLSQAPPPHERVRRGWQVRVTESLGAQHVVAPDLSGVSERPALLMLSRLQLSLAPNAHLPMPGPEDVVVAQFPQPNSTGATEPRVALLVSATPPVPEAAAWAMPRLVGLTVRSAASLLAGAGLHLGSMQSIDSDPAPGANAGGGASTQPNQESQMSGAVPPASGAEPAATEQTPGVNQPHLQSAVAMTDVIVSQFPAPGSRVTAENGIRIAVTSDHTAQSVSSAP